VDPVTFALLSGCIDAIAHLHHKAKELTDMQCQEHQKVSMHLTSVCVY